MEIPITQFLLPDRRQIQQFVEVSEEIGNLALICISKGAMFTAEILTTSQVSLACEYDNEDITIEICSNDDEVLSHLKKLINKSFDIIKSK